MHIAGFLLAALLGGCSIGTTFSRARSEPTYAYRGAGEDRPDRDADVLARGKQPPANWAAVTFLEQEAVPAGAQIVGRLAYATGRPERKEDLIARVKAVAAAAGGDGAVGTFVFADPRDAGRAEGVEAVILRLPRDAAPQDPKTSAKPDAGL